MFYKNLINNNLLKHILLGMIIGIYSLSNLHAETGHLSNNPFLQKTFSQVSVLKSERKFDESIKEIKIILRDYPSNPEVQFIGHLRIGLCDKLLKNYEASSKEYQWAIDCAPSDDTDVQTYIAMATADIGENYMKLNQYDKAYIQYMKIVDNYGDVDYFGNLGVDGIVACLWWQHNDQAIENVLLGISTKYANHKMKFYALEHLANYYVEKHNYDKALVTCRQILNELSLDKYPDLKDMKEKEISNLIQDINTQKSNKK
jgi:tetratricopeptide (TPR) repeat protein